MLRLVCVCVCVCLRRWMQALLLRLSIAHTNTTQKRKHTGKKGTAKHLKIKMMHCHSCFK